MLVIHSTPLTTLVALVTLGFFCGAGARADTLPPVAGDPPESVSAVIGEIQSKAAYAHTSWGMRVVDLDTGAVLVDQAGDRALTPGSIMKVYSTATVLDMYGAEYRFHTPVHRTGSVSDGVLGGDLILVASGDFSFGLREQPDGTLGYNNMPEIDHNYADTGFAGGALVKGSDPLAALNGLAKDVRGSGITEIKGDVIIDARLFETYRDPTDGIISPVWLNENVIDIMTAAASVGQPARIDWRPKIASVKIASDVMTVAENPKPITIELAGPGEIRVTGEIAVGAPPALNIWPVTDPASFARTAFIEALQRAGVTVGANALGPNPADKLPDTAVYSAENKVAEHVSPPLSEFVKVVLKVSYNRGAHLMLCLAAVKAESRDCVVGISKALDLLDKLGVSRQSTYVFDGAGSDDHAKTAPADQTTVLARVVKTPWGQAIRDGMAVLGVDGTQAQNGLGSPAAGHIQIKDGTRVTITPGDHQGIIIAKTQVGYIDTKSGRELAFAIFLNTAPFGSIDDFIAADHDIAAIAAAIQQAY
ncbi:MAG: D-alanyl-D-alanine carboxypeptidase/D-alanyl-D-alanine-endopeptidase [Mesorhizobium sp.]|uniref:D-alanyl-D-alanine carboxypeptidase/D-alanyl-D-alanine endopeptidase n=1 Tax=Mesorhizobium sp. TaxID=1871066 RepID=UPI00121F4AC3|nr:D-alanyl-D-alanine carboxypeptidase/D-alanyl-D-alanine-endopeptidase [Mesorhizobium sp.]TIT24977.1 MAG: D-alanyl-D-alanine carboxypeptidase/D-alanyl-D-alanine-endopeptidase [Mesorhizobium sp.]TKC01137.1 MAG: D-alanyl-D-alanine carboxypeptidase/D-alanyl-D-alanine-endopeptidase [Mesorhizobium sp.]